MQFNCMLYCVVVCDDMRYSCFMKRIGNVVWKAVINGTSYAVTELSPSQQNAQGWAAWDTDMYCTWRKSVSGGRDAWFAVTPSGHERVSDIEAYETQSGAESAILRCVARLAKLVRS
jgi:hypothetical protein